MWIGCYVEVSIGQHLMGLNGQKSKQDVTGCDIGSFGGQCFTEARVTTKLNRIRHVATLEWIETKWSDLERA